MTSDDNQGERQMCILTKSGHICIRLATIYRKNIHTNKLPANKENGCTTCHPFERTLKNYHLITRWVKHVKWHHAPDTPRYHWQRSYVTPSTTMDRMFRHHWSKQWPCLEQQWRFNVTDEGILVDGQTVTAVQARQPDYLLYGCHCATNCYITNSTQAPWSHVKTSVHCTFHFYISKKILFRLHTFIPLACNKHRHNWTLGMQQGTITDWEGVKVCKRIPRVHKNRFAGVCCMQSNSRNDAFTN